MLGFLLALLVSFGALLTSPAPAHAATDVQIDDVTFQNDSFPDGSYQQLHVKWSVPEAATPEVTLTLDFPPELLGRATTFPMVGPNNQPAGTCSVTTTGVTCTVDNAFITANPYGVSGEFWFDVQSQLKNQEDTTHTFEFGEFSQTVDVEANPNWCNTNCEFTGQGVSKWGSYNNADDTIIWTVRIPAPVDGIPAGQAITVTDALDPSVYEIVADGTYPRVREGGALSYNEWGRQTVDYITKPAGEVTWSPDNLVASFTSAPGWAGDPDLGDDQQGTTGSFYLVQWKVRVLDQGKAGTYTNAASYTIGDDQSGNTSGSATRYSGGATVVGANFGRFQITKDLIGEAALNPTFTVSYLVYDDTVDPTTPIDSGTFEIRSGQSFISDEYFKGSRVVFTEVQPTEPDNVVWETPIFVGPDGTPITEISFTEDPNNLGQISEIRLVNEANLIDGTIVARKIVENPDGIVTNVDSFRILVSRQANLDRGITPLAGGQILLPADGTEVSVEYAAGTGYSFLESFVPAPRGTTWADPVYTVNDVTYTEGEFVNLPLNGAIDLTVTNTITQNVGGFSITKEVSGDGETLVPAGTLFTVNYSYTSVNGFDAGSGTVTVAAGATSDIVDDIPEGATVTLEEVTPVNPVGGTWGTPQFDVASFVVVKDQIVEISLDNPITWNNGSFSVLKVVDGDGADLVADDVAFEVDYTYTLPEDLGIVPGTGQGQLTVLNDGSAVPSAELPYGTEVTLSEATPAPIAGATWTSAVFDQSTFTIGDQTVLAVTLTNTLERDYGSFSISKSVIGTGAHLVGDDETFTVEYSYPAGPGFEAGSGTVEVGHDGAPVVVDTIPANAVVTLSEVAPTNPEGGTWHPAQFTNGNIVTIVKDENVDVALVNEIDLNSGSFSVVKVITGDGASLVPATATFAVDYSFPAANGYEAGSGTLEVPADGTAVTSTAIPFGAEVSLVETRPDAVTGATWTGAAFSTDAVTIGDGTVTEVTLTNTIEADAVVDPPRRRPLPDTGVGSNVSLGAAAAVALLAAGGLLMVVSRRRRAL